MSIAGTLGRHLVILAALAAVSFASGCTVTTYPSTYPSTPPPNIQAAPRGYYNGNTTYWYDNHWWYRTPNGWAYYRDEPRELQRYRPGVQQPPPAYPHGGGPGYAPPPPPPPLPAPR